MDDHLLTVMRCRGLRSATVIGLKITDVAILIGCQFLGASFQEVISWIHISDKKLSLDSGYQRLILVIRSELILKYESPKNTAVGGCTRSSGDCRFQSHQTKVDQGVSPIGSRCCLVRKI